MILVIPKKTMTVQQKNELTKKGHIVIECDNPDKVKVINPESPIETNDLFLSALYALKNSSSDYPKAMFVSELYKRLCDDVEDTKKAEQKKKANYIQKTVLKEPIKEY